MTWVVSASDSFNRANGSLNGSSLDNAAGGSGSNTWTTKTGTWTVTSNQARQTAGGADEIVVVDSLAAAGDMKVSATLNATDCGPVARWSTGGISQGNYYLAYRNFSSNALQLYKRTDGGFTQLGSDGTTAANGDVITLVCQGTSISILKNGSTAVGPVTDATFSTGKPGLYAGGGADQDIDDFLYETDATAFTIAGAVSVQQRFASVTRR